MVDEFFLLWTVLRMSRGNSMRCALWGDYGPLSGDEGWESRIGSTGTQRSTKRWRGGIGGKGWAGDIVGLVILILERCSEEGER